MKCRAVEIKAQVGCVRCGNCEKDVEKDYNYPERIRPSYDSDDYAPGYYEDNDSDCESGEDE